MPLSPGTRLGIYEIVSPLGAGGMGEVYRARDTRLSRDVALKILSDPLVGDAEGLARFEHEAQALAALNHPHIAQIYGTDESAGSLAIIMELVEGPTLADRLADGGLPLDEAIRVAVQIAEALEAAHEHGIVHRDLKPANIKIRTDGVVKVLDFGLAKTLHSPLRGRGRNGEPIDPSNSPTVMSPPTQSGVLLGTAAYMAPEQAQGRTVDKRVDIWAFGCVLYEMLTGRRAFGGETVSDTLASVLRDEVDWSILPPAVPPAMIHVLKRCLERNPKRRFHDIADVRIEISEPYDPVAGDTRARPPARVARAIGLFLAGAIVAGVALWLAMGREAAGPGRVRRFALAGLDSLLIDPNQTLTLSPDGRELAYRGRGPDGVDRLFVRQLDALVPTAVGGTEGARQPFFSPDGQWLGFFADGALKKVPVGGGAPQTIAPATTPLGASWMDDGSIVFVADVGSGLLRVRSSGGPPEAITLIDSQKDVLFATPWALPGSRGILITVRRDNRFDVAAVSFDERKLHVLVEDAYSPILTSNGHVLFHQGNSIFALPFDHDRLAATGPAFPVLSGLSTRISFQTRIFAVARDGTLAYVPAAPREEGARMMWVDRSGQSSIVSRFDRPADTPRLSPDGSKVAFRTPAPNCDVWIHHLVRGTTTRLTHEGDNHGVVWMNDGARIATARERRESTDIIALHPDGSGSSERIATFPVASGAVPSSWSSGTLLIQRGDGRSGLDVSAVSPAKPDPTPVVHSPFEDSGAVLSPDGRAIAYVSNETGRAEVYLQPLARQEQRIQVSTAGGMEPVWSRNGRELFFRRGRDLIAVPIATAPSLSVGPPTVLFSGDYAFGPLAATVSGMANYDVAADGKRFLMMSGTQWLQGQLVVVLDWFADWKQLGSGARP